MAEQSNSSGKLNASAIMSSDIAYDFFCEVCSEDGKHLEAEGYCVDCRDYLCRDCFKGHMRNRASRDHVLQDKTQMPQQKPSPSVTVPSTGSFTDKCARHPNRLVEYYCRDERSLGCSVCMTVNHRLCNSVDHIPELAEQLLDSHEYTQFTNTLSNLKNMSQSVIKNTKENVMKAEKVFSDAENMLIELREKMNEAFDKFEKDLKSKASTIKSADLKKMQGISDKGQAVFDEVKIISAELQSLQSKNQLDQLFIYMLKLEDKVETLHKLLAETDTDTGVTAYTLEPGHQIQEIIDDPNSIGKLSTRHTAKPALPPHISTHVLKTNAARSAASAATGPIDKDSKKMNVELVCDVNELVCDVNVKTKSDTKSCLITGSALLPDNKVVLADYNNFKVKLLNLQTSEVIAELNTCYGPWNVSSITSDQVAATLYRNNTIVFVKVTDTLKKDREMSVAGACTAILHNNGKLIVAFANPVKIEIMALDGTVERKIEEPDWFTWPSHMTLSLDCKTIYVADDERGFIKRITLTGAVQAIYRDTELKTPRGLTVDKYGRVLACGGASRNIQLLTPDLAKVKVIVDNLNYTSSLSYCHFTGRLFAGMSSDNVKVYQLS